MDKPLVSVLARSGDTALAMELDPDTGVVIRHDAVQYNLLAALSGSDAASMAGSLLTPLITFLGKRDGRALFTVTTVALLYSSTNIRSRLVTLGDGGIATLASYSGSPAGDYTSAFAIAGSRRAFVVLNTLAGDAALIVTLAFNGAAQAGTYAYRIDSAVAVESGAETLLAVEYADTRTN